MRSMMLTSLMKRVGRLRRVGAGMLALVSVVALGTLVYRNDWTAWTVCVFVSACVCLYLGVRATGWVKRPSQWQVTQAAQQQMLSQGKGRTRADRRRRARRKKLG